MHTFGELVVVDPRTLRPVVGVAQVTDAVTGDPVATYTSAGDPAPVVSSARGYVGQFQTADGHPIVRLSFPSGDPVVVTALDQVTEAAKAVEEMTTGRLSPASLSTTIATETEPIARTAGADAAVTVLADQPAVTQAAATRAVSVAADPAMAGVAADDDSQFIAALTGNGRRPIGRGELVVSVRDYAHLVDSFGTDWTPAIRAALAATPRGGTLFFPAGVYRVSQQAEPWILRINRATKLVGQGPSSMIMLDATIPNTTDVILIQPDVGTDPSGYGVSGLNIAAEGSAAGVARHALHIDLTVVGARVRTSAFEDNIFGPTGGRSIKITNPVNTDGIWASRFTGNLIWSGVLFERAGDSIMFIQNTVAGDHAVDISLVGGSAGLVLAYNNITCRGGVRIRSGHLIKVLYNNLEVGYADATGSNGALLDIDGSEIDRDWGLLAVEVLGNNFGHRTGSPDGITGLRINKARSVLVEGNHFGYKNNQQIHITNLATETIIGYNLYSADNPEGFVLDQGARTIRKDVPRRTPSGAREMWAYEAANFRTSSNEALTQTRTQVWKTPAAGDAQRHNYRWPASHTGRDKHIIATQRENADGTLEPAKTVARLADGYMYFNLGTFVLVDPNGFRWTVDINTDGTIKTTRM